MTRRRRKRSNRPRRRSRGGRFRYIDDLEVGDVANVLAALGFASESHRRLLLRDLPDGVVERLPLHNDSNDQLPADVALIQSVDDSGEYGVSLTAKWLSNAALLLESEGIAGAARLREKAAKVQRKDVDSAETDSEPQIVQHSTEEIAARLPTRSGLFLRSLRHHRKLAKSDIVRLFGVRTEHAIRAMVEPITTEYQSSGLQEPYIVSRDRLGNLIWIWVGW